MKTVRINKGNIFNIVPIGTFEEIYKKHGWKIIADGTESELNSEVKKKGIVNEKQQNAFIKAKHEKAKQKFNDGLLKVDNELQI